MPERTFGEALAGKVRARLRRVLAKAPAAIVRGHGGELHQLRIDVKRLRYTLEFALTVAPADAPPALELLALLQERLGALADADTFGRTYLTLLERIDENDERRAGASWLAASAERDREFALAAVRALWSAQTPPYADRLAAAVGSLLGGLTADDTAPAHASERRLA